MKAEHRRGVEQSSQHMTALREKWPLAFPVKPHDIRPLAISCASEIATAMGWSLPYTHGVLVRWKKAAAYCRAVLRYEHRIALDGTPAEPVDAEAKDKATKQLAKLAARKAKKAAETAKPAPSPAPPPEPPKPLHDQVRASLLRRVAHKRPPTRSRRGRPAPCRRAKEAGRRRGGSLLPDQ